MCMCVCVCMCVCNIGKKVLKLQFSDNKDIGLIFIYEITSSCISTSSFAVLDIIFSTPLSNNMNVVELVSDLYSIAILDTSLLVEYYIYFVCVFVNLQIIFSFITLGLPSLAHFYNDHTIELL